VSLILDKRARSRILKLLFIVKGNMLELAIKNVKAWLGCGSSGREAA
jgi:hypothetical protein